jgi:hypothetical protein
MFKHCQSNSGNESKQQYLLKVSLDLYILPMHHSTAKPALESKGCLSQQQSSTTIMSCWLTTLVRQASCALLPHLQHVGWLLSEQLPGTWYAAQLHASANTVDSGNSLAVMTPGEDM